MIELRPGKCRVLAPAKLNLHLEVLGRRPDGYHELETVMQTVDLYDELTFELTGGEVGLVTDHPSLPTGEDNLVARAAKLLKELGGVEAGVKMTLLKRIPTGAGMGGGSSDAASTLVGLNLLWKLGWPVERLQEPAAALGSDVPFFLTGGAALCRGRGEIVTPMTGLEPSWYVVVTPPVEVSTRRVYENLASHLTNPALGHNVLMQKVTGRHCDGRQGCFNRLQEVTLGVYPQLNEVVDTMRRLGLANVGMTGSGSGFFASCTSRKEAHDTACRLAKEDIGTVFQLTSTPGPD